MTMDFRYFKEPEPKVYNQMVHDGDEYMDQFGIESFDELESQKDRIHEFDWDYMFILDACRWDALNLALPEHEVEYLHTQGPETPVWLPNTWTEDSYDLTYVSGTPMTKPTNDWEVVEDVPDMSKIMNLIQCTRQRDKSKLGAWDRRFGTSLPEDLIEITMDLEVTTPIVTHLMQPHTPFIGDLALTARHTIDETDIKKDGPPGRAYALVEQGLIDISVVRVAYFMNLITALDEIDTFLHKTERIEGRGSGTKVVLTADHGEILDQDNCTHGSFRQPETMIVPWVEIEI